MKREKRLEYTAAAVKIAEQMTLEEKVALMSGDTTLQMTTDMKREGYHFNYEPFHAGGSERYHVPSLKFCDGPRGVVCGCGKTTCFPVPMMRGATFDIELEEQIGHAIGREVRASGGNLFGGVCINLPYHPGWGRSQEVYGEDSFAMGAMGSAIVRGIQSEYVIACLKHYAFNSMENSRFEVNIDCTQRTEREVFLSHFKDCIDAGAAAVMTAYNQYQGKLCGHSEYLLQKVLKEEWKFDGFAISDFFWGVLDTVEAANAGLDIEMCHTRYYGRRLVDAVRNGLVKETVVDAAAVRIIRTLNAFEEAYKESGCSYGEEVLGCREHVELSLRAAQEGITLIKNKDHVLPLSKDTKRIAVIGRLAAKINIGDNGSSRVYPSYVVTPLEGIVKESPNTEVVFYDGNDLNHMKRLAEEAEAVVFVVGLDYRDEGEYNPMKETAIIKEPKGGDRHTLRLHPDEVNMLNTVGPVNPTSVAVVMGGSTITVTEWEQSISAILYTYYPGQEGGTAIAQILFGTVNPSGKLPFVLPKDEKDLPEINWNTTNQHYGYYHGYHYFEKKGICPYRPYGFGMSYTTFQLSDAKVTCRTGQIRASVLVKNTGDIKGTEVIQLYVGFQSSELDRPVKTLCGFKRVTLGSEKAKRVKIVCPVEKIKYYNVETHSFELEHMEYEIYIGTSSAKEDLICEKINI